MADKIDVVWKFELVADKATCIMEKSPWTQHFLWYSLPILSNSSLTFICNEIVRCLNGKMINVVCFIACGPYCVWEILAAGTAVSKENKKKRDPVTRFRRIFLCYLGAEGEWTRERGQSKLREAGGKEGEQPTVWLHYVLFAPLSLLHRYPSFYIWNLKKKKEREVWHNTSCSSSRLFYLTVQCML